MKKLFAFALMMILTLSALSASAASLMQAPVSAIPNQVPILSITCGWESVSGALTDDDSSTVYYQPSGGENQTLMLSMGQTSVSDIWIRSGDYSGKAGFDYYRAPAVIHVTICSMEAGRLSNMEYDYAMDTSYNPYTVNESWHYGYQRMALPRTFSNVVYIGLTVTDARAGNHAGVETAITDIVISSGNRTATSPSVLTPTPTPAPASSKIPGVLKMRLATRTGPSTNYTEPGSFHSAGYELDVISQAYDDRNGIWWVQVEFEYKGEKMRAYTGVKRVEVNLQYVPVEESLGSVRITQNIPNPWYGPGYNYRKHKNPVPGGTVCTVYGRENGFLLVEYHDGQRNLYRRVWVPENLTQNF